MAVSCGCNGVLSQLRVASRSILSDWDSPSIYPAGFLEEDFSALLIDDSCITKIVIPPRRLGPSAYKYCVFARILCGYGLCYLYPARGRHTPRSWVGTMSRRFQRFTFLVLFAAVCTLPFESLRTALPDREPAGVLQYCGAGLRSVGRGTVALVKAPYHGANWIANIPRRRADREAQNAHKYDEVARRNLTEYFKDAAAPTDAEIKTFLEDFSYVYENFATIHLPSRTTARAQKHFEDLWQQVGPELVREPSFITRNANKSLESLFLERHFEATRTEAAKRDAQIRDLRHYAWRVVGLPYFGLVKVGGMLLGESKWTGRLILATILGTAFANIHEPITANLSTFVNQHLGWVGVQLQMGITRLTADLERAREVHEQMQVTHQEMDSATQKYRIRELSKDQAIKLWENLDETFLNYSKEMRSVIPDNIATGRAYYKDGNFTNPIAFVTAAATINIEKMEHESVVRTLKLKESLTKQPLSLAESAELEFHSKQIEVSKKRLGTVVAMWRVYEIIYPELTRAAFMKAGMDGHQIRASYEVYRQGLDFEAYAQEYTEQMKTALLALGMEIQQIDAARVASIAVAAEAQQPSLEVNTNLTTEAVAAERSVPVLQGLAEQSSRTGAN
jgi:hypothetical protein